MGQGWETRRSRPPGEDWIVLRLGVPGRLNRLVLDTAFFKGNFPERAAVDGLWWPDAPGHLLAWNADWTPVLPPSRLHADRAHDFGELSHRGPFTHLRIRIFPDGGIARFRAWGEAADPPEEIPLDDAALRRCCGAERWVRAMADGRPFRTRAQVLGLADHHWWRLGEADWKEAFAHHPRIGEDVEDLRQRFAATADLSAREQAGVAAADEATLQALADGNRRYAERFGHIFIVCATGLGAAEMLARLRDRLDNEPANEIRVAAGEQAKITRLRLEALLP
jgi:allantoicase